MFDNPSGGSVGAEIGKGSRLGKTNLRLNLALQVLKRSKDTIWLAETTADEVGAIITLFFKTGIVMYTKHETLHTLSDGDKPCGFVEIGRFRPLK